MNSKQQLQCLQKLKRCNFPLNSNFTFRFTLFYCKTQFINSGEHFLAGELMSVSLLNSSGLFL